MNFIEFGKVLSNVIKFNGDITQSFIVLPRLARLPLHVVSNCKAIH